MENLKLSNSFLIAFPWVLNYENCHVSWETRKHLCFPFWLISRGSKPGCQLSRSREQTNQTPNEKAPQRHQRDNMWQSPCEPTIVDTPMTGRANDVLGPYPRPRTRLFSTVTQQLSSSLLTEFECRLCSVLHATFYAAHRPRDCFLRLVLMPSTTLIESKRRPGSGTHPTNSILYE